MTVHSLTSLTPGRPDAPLQIAVVGRGFSGLMMAIALLKTIERPFRLRMFDPQSSISGGLALAGSNYTEILNSRVRDLSVSLGESRDFTHWLVENSAFRESVPAAIPGFGQIFVPKAIFSDYVYQRFSQALAARQDVSIQMSAEIVSSVKRLADGRFALTLDHGEQFQCDSVVLATGYGARGNPERPEPAPTVTGRRLMGPRHVVVVGSGLRAVDRVLQLREGGFSGRITVLSRHGFLPQPHTRFSAQAVFPQQPMPSRLTQILRFVRRACAEAEANGDSWQAVMNGLRKRARSLWSSLPQNEKRQFNRHLRAIYDAHRNRLPIDVHTRFQRELDSELTTVERGTLLHRTLDGISVRRPRQDTDEMIQCDDVIDCRCLAANLDHPLIASLLDAGLAAKDELELGLSVNAAGEVLAPRHPGVHGRMAGLFAIGPLGLGSLPDIDLVPEIVSQSYAAAALIEDYSRPQLQAG